MLSMKERLLIHDQIEAEDKRKRMLFNLEELNRRELKEVKEGQK